MAETEIVAQIGLLIYPGAQMAAVHGLTDLFRISCEWARPLESAARAIRMTHWKDEGNGAGPICVWDSHPRQDHVLTHVIAPPSIIMPDRMGPMPEAAAWMNGLHARGTRLCSVCAGAFVLAETGLMDGRRATTHWAFAETLAARFPGVEVATESILLDDGDIMTAGGILAWTDLGLTLVGQLLGPSIMLATARFLVIDPPRREQRPFAQFLPRFNHGDAAVLRAQHQLHATGAQSLNVPDLARSVGLEERTFLRRFIKATGLRPTEYAQNIRVAKAREALELSNASVEQIAFQVGYGDPAAFRKVFQKITGLAPNAYRQRFGIS